MEEQDRGLGSRKCLTEPKAINQIARLAEGDLRKAYNILEIIVDGLSDKGRVSEHSVALFAKERSIRYDRDEDEHYDTASALIKSMRGNDPDAALYWLAKMLVGGEDPRFIARRLVIFASEDVGLADSRALLMADATFRACETIGLPECELNLSHCVLFLATSPKSNSSTLALAAAKRAIRDNPVQSIPPSIQDRHGRNKKYRDEQEEGYLYSHDFPENISGQSYLEKDLQLYVPKNSGAEERIEEKLNRWKTLRAQAKSKE
jgi:putative ATPase